MDGGCRCDRVRIRVTSKPLITMACHCNGCQRMSSSAFSLTAMFFSDAFEVNQGKPVIGGLHGSEATISLRLLHDVDVHAPGARAEGRERPSHDVRRASVVCAYIETYTKTKLPWAFTGAARSFEEFLRWKSMRIQSRPSAERSRDVCGREDEIEHGVGARRQTRGRRR